MRIAKILLAVSLALGAGLASAQQAPMQPPPGGPGAQGGQPEYGHPMNAQRFQEIQQRILQRIQNREQRLQQAQSCVQQAQDMRSLRACAPHRRGEGPREGGGPGMGYQPQG